MTFHRYPSSDKHEAKQRARRTPGKTFLYEMANIDSRLRKVYVTYSNLGDGRFYFNSEIGETVVILDEINFHPYSESTYIERAKPIPFKVYYRLFFDYVTSSENWSQKLEQILAMDEDTIESVQLMTSIGE